MNTSFSLASIKAIIGLGNPSQQYAKNRHNIGFRIVDELADQYGGSWHTTGDLMSAEIQLIVHNMPKKVILIKPQTYMNSSGKVIPWLQKKGIAPEEILVVHDELEKKLGALQLRLGGSARGHNGLKSLISAMGENFWRLRFGIDRPADKAEVPNYVLANFKSEEEQQLPTLIDQACSLVTT